MGRLPDRHPPRLASLLEARRHVGGVADRRVVHAQVAADRAHHDEAGVEALAGAEADAARRELRLVVVERPLDAEGGVDGAARMVLVGDRGPEERHDAVAEELVDRALVAVDLGEHEVEGPAHEPVDLLGVEALGQRGEAGDVHEEHRHLFALALERAARGEDLLGQVLRRVGPGRGELIGGGARRKRPAALVAEPVARRVRRLADRAHHLEARAAAAAEAGVSGVRLAAARTGHRVTATSFMASSCMSTAVVGASRVRVAGL